MVSPSLGLYVHIPFCQYRCSYCDFATFADQDQHIDRYVELLCREIALRAGDAPPRPAHTIFFGGGTPSRLPSAAVARILDALRDAFALAPGAEITLEANPGTLDLAHMRALCELGVSRLSIGVQSLNDALLLSLNRIHDAQQALEALASARRAGFASVNADLIFGLPGQDLADWERTLDGVLSAEPDHLSIYGLIVEPGTLLRRQVRSGAALLPEEDEAATMYETARERLAAAGYQHYEISNWARPGHQCLHNLIYWQHQPYLGVGLSSHSYLDGVRFANVRGLQGYLSRLERGRLPTATTETIDGERARADAAMLGLRLIRGIQMPSFDSRFGGDFAADHADAISRMTSLGLLEVVDAHVRLTPRGYLLANQVWQEFI
jgi:oxygen-independent coproporphyrinogen-3 oxidase